MSLPRDLEEQVPLTSWLLRLSKAVTQVARGWRAPRDQAKDDAKAAATAMDAKVTQAIRTGVARAEAKEAKKKEG